MKTEKIYTQHEENKEWANNLLFYQDELKVMQNRLQEVASKNSAKEVLMQIEHFQNQIIIQNQQIDILKHEINLSNDTINEEIKKNGVAVDHRKIEDHAAAREKMEAFGPIYKSFKTELNVFLSKWM